MDTTQHIVRHQRADAHNSDLRLRKEPVKLNVRRIHGVVPCGDGWEMAVSETTTEEANKARMRIKHSRKQIAARKLIKAESRKEIKKVPMSRRLTDMRLMGMDTTVEELTQEIRDLWKVADPQRKQRPERLLEEERKALFEKFEERRTK